VSELGPARKRNEDRFLVDEQQGLFIVADGLGGLPGGDVAAEIVVQVLPALLRERGGIGPPCDPLLAERVAHALRELSGLVRRAAEERPGLTGLGATALVTLLRGRHALVAHLGDSRAYLLRGARLELLTTDHTLVEALIAAGEVSRAHADTHPGRGRLTRYAGMAGEVLPDTRQLELRPGDRLLLSSDGLTGVVEDARLREILGGGLEPRRTCEALIATANAAGARDNITTIVIDIDAA
jgi:serine/threonine protein phosphatase PrpC